MNEKLSGLFTLLEVLSRQAYIEADANIEDNTDNAKENLVFCLEAVVA